MRQPWEWTEADIGDLITNQVQERIDLDYKACDALAKNDKRKAEISKDVSAFANSAGGVIIYGVNETDHLPTSIDVGYDQTEITKEWLEQVINSNIQRRIDGIRINPLGLKTGKCIYVVSIPQSLRAPHMAKDNKYYKRFNFQSVPMEEYEVRDVARRVEAPELRLKFELLAQMPEMQMVELKITISNLSVEPAQYAVATVFLARSIQVLRHNEFHLDEVRYLNNGRTHNFSRLQRSWGPPLLPIWYGQDFPLGETPLHLGVPWANIVSRQSSPIVGWQLTSPKMITKEEFYRIGVAPQGYRLDVFDLENG